ncbi:uncharacterized protein EV154DRAFT_489054 [Mucor mucedo]|uniref:uncharacterized protein n=1 Tax=Mucor mucedo TaxID=29922 RepID=UPI00221FEC86|nr:uncharacterized protein EV154DRAFT_489054 [Mucor mucedo]KAI7863553.1 hypothetical protein EV154DRAFT_489054 [Mucor mucedo]
MNLDIRVLENSPKFERVRKNNFRESEIKIDGVIIGQSFKIRLLNYIVAAKHGAWLSVDVFDVPVIHSQNPQVIANIPRKLQTRPRFKPVTPARYKRQRLLNLVLGPARPY